MSNNKTPTNAFSATNQPTPGNTRGKAPKRLTLNAVKKITGLNEADLYEYIVDQAFNHNDEGMMDLVLRNAMPAAKTSLPPFEFQYDRNLPTHEKCELILEAVANGDLPPDVGSIIIADIKEVADVKAAQEYEARISELEAALKAVLGK